MKSKPVSKQLEDKQRMFFLIAALLISGFLLTSFASYMVSRNSIRQSLINNELPLISDNIYSEVQRDLLKPVFISSLMSNDTFLRDWILSGENDVEAIQKYLTEIKDKYGTISSFFVSEKTYRYYYPGGILKSIDPADIRDAWYFRLRETKQPYEINVDVDLANGDMMTIFVNYRVYDFEGNLIGATGVGLSVSMVKQLMVEYQQRYHRNIYFVDHSGKIILQSTDQKTSTHSKKTLDDIPGLDRFSKQILNGNLHNFEYRQQGSTVLLNVRFIPDLNWYLLVEQVEDEALSILRRTLIANIVICLVISAVVLVIIRFIIRRYRSRLESRNVELENKNLKINEQREHLKQQTQLLEDANKDLALLNQDKDEFIGIIVHDLKSPLHAIVGFADLISLDPKTSAEIQEFSSYIQISAQKMMEQITVLMNMGEAESEIDLPLNPFDFSASVNRTLDHFKLQAQNKEIEFDINIPDKPLLALGNENWVVEIVGNLVSNAIKYSPKQKTVRIELQQREDQIRLVIADEGPGITAEEMPNLFKKYSRLSSRPTGTETATGLGLYIVKIMTQRLGGKTWCDSKVGEGSQFFVEFPAA